jgi:hypothetical protein
MPFPQKEKSRPNARNGSFYAIKRRFWQLLFQCRPCPKSEWGLAAHISLISPLMEITTILGIVIAILLVCLIAAMFYVQRLQQKIADIQEMRPAANAASGQQHLQLQLGACERLTLFAERTKLNNLIARLFNSSYSSREMQQTLTGAIREEYDYNISQQLYVDPQIWEAVTKLKEQNIYIVNQISAALPPTATALDLNKHLLDFVVQNPKATMNGVVLEALQFEAKKLISA